MKPPSLRTVASRKIHPQLPLDPRQSQQLLAVLKSSFQKQLDLAHPAPGSSTWPQLTSATSFSPYCNARPKSQLPQASAMQHIDNILSNPLLESRPDPRSFIFGREPRRLQNLDGPSKLSEAHEWFINHVASGSADSYAAKVYLRVVHQACSTLEGGAAQKCIKEAGSGGRVVQWLFSNLGHFSAPFWKDIELCRLMTKCLVAEKRDDDIQRLLSLPSCTQEDLLWRRCLMRNSVTTSLAFGTDLAEVVRTFLSNAYAFCKAPANIRAEGALFVLSNAGNHLAAAIMSPDSGIAIQAYDALVESLPLWAGEYSLSKALLPLHHPSKPDVATVITFLSQIHMEARLTRMTPSRRRRALQMCLDATQLLLTRRDFTTSTWLLEFTKRNFIQELEAEQVPCAENENAFLRKFSELHIKGTEHMEHLAIS